MGVAPDATLPFQQPPYRAQADIGMKRRSEQPQHDSARLLSHVDGGVGESRLAYPGLALQCDSPCGQRAGRCFRPISLEMSQFMLPADQRSPHTACDVALGNCAIV